VTTKPRPPKLVTKHVAYPAEIVDQFGDSQMHIVWHVVASWSCTRPTDAKITLGTMPWSVHTMTVWPTAALVGFDQRAAQHLLHRRQFAHQLATAFAQGSGGESLQFHRTESDISPIESEADSSVNSRCNVERGNELGQCN
jgi:hypothetical protein